MELRELSEMASHIMFGKANESLLLEHWEYRKGKSVSDINHAIRKSKKNGMGKTEYEERMLAIYLSEVFKRRRKPLLQVVAAAIEGPDGTFLCGKRRDKLRNWEFIGGKVEDQETHIEALKREVFEEVDCEVEVGELMSVGVWGNKFILRVFHARITSGTPVNNVHEELRWMTREQMKENEWLESNIAAINLCKRG